MGKKRENELAIKRGSRWLDHRLVLRLVQSLAFQVFKSLFYTCLLSDLAIITRDILGFFLHTSFSSSPDVSPCRPLPFPLPLRPSFLFAFVLRSSFAFVFDGKWTDEGSGICNVILWRNERHVPRAYRLSFQDQRERKREEQKIKGERCRRTLRSLFKSAREDQFVDFREYF